MSCAGGRSLAPSSRKIRHASGGDVRAGRIGRRPRGRKTVAAEEVKTTGPAIALQLRLEDGDIQADGEDMAILTCFCEDADGNIVPDACPVVSFDTNELGRIVGTGSDVCDHTPVPSLERRMRAGLISIAIKVGDQSGILRVYARAEGLVPARLDIDVAPAVRRPFL